VLPGDLIHNGIHELVGINRSSEQGPVSAELRSAEGGCDDYRVMNFGEGCPARYCGSRVLGEKSIRLRAIYPREAVGQDEYPDGGAWNEGGYAVAFPHQPASLLKGG
jgi:hypothetical protein